MRSLRRRVLLPLMLGTTSSTMSQTVRDSAGVRIAENPARATAPMAFRLGAHTLDIGGPADNPDDELNRGMGKSGLRLADGTIALPDAVRIQFFDAQGKSSGMLGRAGAGPQEFRSLAGAEFCKTRGDTLVAGDLRNGRFAVIHDRRVVHTIPYSTFGGAMVGCFDDGSILMQSAWFGSAPTYTVRLNRLRLDGTFASKVGEFELRAPRPITHMVYARSRVFGQRVYVGDGTTSEVRVYSADGKLTQIVRTADRPKPITAADVARDLQGKSPRPEDLTSPMTYPTYHNFLLDADGRLWVQDFMDVSFAGRGWTAFDRDGRMIGRLEIPEFIGKNRPTVVGFGVNEVQLGIADDDGFYHIRFFPLLRTPSR